MKKIYSFLALMLFLVAGTAQAQRGWNVSETVATEIIPGEGHYYVLQEGVGIPQWSESKYLNSGSNECVAEVNTSCIYSFIETGETKSTADGQVFKIFVLKNLENGKYLCAHNDTEGYYTKSKSSAFQFTARKAKEYQNGVLDEENWDEYSEAVMGLSTDGSAGPNAGAEAQGAWVLCAPNSKSYITFVKNPAILGYWDTNNWFIYEATEYQMSAYQQFMVTFNKYFAIDVNEENYPIGVNPGQISDQAAYDNLYQVYQQAIVLAKNSSASEAEYNQCAADIVAAFEAVDASRNPIKAGYFIFIAQRSQDALRDTGAGTYAQNWSAPETWTLSNANVIWELVPAKEKDTYYMRNFATGRYMGTAPGTSAQFPVSKEPVAVYTFPRPRAAFFDISQGGKLMHCDGSYKAVTWQDATAGGNLHQVLAADPAVIEALQAQADSIQSATKLTELLAQANQALHAFDALTDCTFDGDFSAEGLVTTAVGNHTEPNEGSIDNLFDANTTTFYHTNWSGGVSDANFDWIDVDLGKEVQNIFIKIARRPNTSYNCAPSRFNLYTIDDGEDPDNHTTAWGVKLVDNDTIDYTYDGVYSGATKAQHVAILKIDLPQPAQYLRFEVTKTPQYGINPSTQCRTITLEDGVTTTTVPWWNASEFRVYENLGDDPRAALIPAEVKARLEAAIAAAEAEIAAGKFTEAVYTKLEEAIDAYYEAYPDPATLEALIETAKGLIEGAVEGTEMGYFEAGAKDELQAVVNKVEADIDGKILTLAELKTYEDQMNAAIKAFNGKMIVPEAGKVYQITSASDNEDIYGQYVYAPNCDLEETAWWGYSGDANIDSRINTLWLVETCGEGYAFKNIGTGLYLKNIYDGVEDPESIDEGSHLAFSTTPSAFEFVSPKIAGVLSLMMADGHYVNTEPTGYIVTYYDADDINARFNFTEVESYDMEMAAWPIQADALQVVVLPFESTTVMAGAEGTPAYKVLGQKNGELQLMAYAEDETIPAGTPFIVETGDTEDPSESQLMVFHDNFLSLEALLGMTYNYEPIEQNGLIGTFSTIEAPYAAGIFIGHELYSAEGFETIAAGSGYLKNVPETEEDGEYTVGMPTGIQNATVIRKESGNVYTVSGILVRKDAKVGNALQNLPKGVYIMNGKKFIVK